MILVSAKYNYNCDKEINLLSSSRFSKTFLKDAFKNFSVKNEKVNKFDLNYYRYMVQPLVLHILQKIPTLKISPPEGGGISSPTEGVLLPRIQKLHIILIFLL